MNADMTLWDLVKAGSGPETDKEVAAKFAAGFKTHDGRELREHEQAALAVAFVDWLEADDPIALADASEEEHEVLTITNQVGMKAEVPIPSWLAQVLCGPAKQAG